jgi:hypothetical protein
MTTIRAKSYVYLKILKAHAPGLKRVRLLKTEPPVAEYDGRPILDSSQGNSLLFEWFAAGEPRAAGKIGDTELEVLLKRERSGGDPEAFFESISKGHELELLHLNCGVFPKRQDVLARWAETYLDALRSIDLLAVWHNTGEGEIVAKHAPQATLAQVRSLEPYYHDPPWSRVLAQKQVTVVTPFADSIEGQHARYTGRALFPATPDVLPDFELSVVRAPFSAALAPPTHRDWHHALEELKERIAATACDVYLIGAGAWSLPLCAFVRNELRRPAIHLGGALQILFGVRGKRWESHPVIGRFFNKNWIRPLPHETPRRQWMNDGGAYW